jgi:hypothetical protein
VERRARAVATDLDDAGPRMLSEHLPTPSPEPSEALPKIDGLRRHQNATLGGELEHERTSRKARTNGASAHVDSAPWMRSRVPSARDISLWMAPAGGGQEGAEGTATQPREVGGCGTAGGPAAGLVAIGFLRSAKRNRHGLATRDGDTTAVNATAWAQSSGGLCLWGCGRVWRQ